MVPHLEEYYLDNLHPNALGTEVYGRNLVEEIRRIGF
jgi:lysophospholipase L1-like esterase